MKNFKKTLRKSKQSRNIIYRSYKRAYYNSFTIKEKQIFNFLIRKGFTYKIENYIIKNYDTINYSLIHFISSLPNLTFNLFKFLCVKSINNWCFSTEPFKNKQINNYISSLINSTSTQEFKKLLISQLSRYLRDMKYISFEDFKIIYEQSYNMDHILYDHPYYGDKINYQDQRINNFINNIKNLIDRIPFSQAAKTEILQTQDIPYFTKLKILSDANLSIKEQKYLYEENFLKCKSDSYRDLFINYCSSICGELQSKLLAIADYTMTRALVYNASLTKKHQLQIIDKYINKENKNRRHLFQLLFLNPNLDIEVFNKLKNLDLLSLAISESTEYFSKEVNQELNKYRLLI